MSVNGVSSRVFQFLWDLGAAFAKEDCDAFGDCFARSASQASARVSPRNRAMEADKDNPIVMKPSHSTVPCSCSSLYVLLSRLQPLSF